MIVIHPKWVSLKYWLRVLDLIDIADRKNAARGRQE